MEGGQKHRLRAQGELQENQQGGSPAPSQSPQWLPVPLHVGCPACSVLGGEGLCWVWGWGMLMVQPGEL